MTTYAPEATKVADAYLAIWNERDGDTRRAFIDATWTTDGLILPLCCAVRDTKVSMLQLAGRNRSSRG